VLPELPGPPRIDGRDLQRVWKYLMDYAAEIERMREAAAESEQVADIMPHPGNQEFPAGNLDEYLERPRRGQQVH
jgi:hypothetical protein